MNDCMTAVVVNGVLIAGYLCCFWFSLHKIYDWLMRECWINTGICHLRVFECLDQMPCNSV